MIIEVKNHLKWEVVSNRQGEDWAYYTSTLAEAIFIALKKTKEYVGSFSTGKTFAIDEVYEFLNFAECDIENDVITNSENWTCNDYAIIKGIGVDI